MRIPVVDIFAGPGGLGEGFASYRSRGTSRAFEIAVSIEKDSLAHRTLRLRAFHRQFDSEDLPPAYFDHLRGKISWEQLAKSHPAASRAASIEARHLELGSETVHEARGIIAAALGDSDTWVLVGGPPCQAYSLVGRARNRGIKSYVPEKDHRQTLYVEYLQILADHAPPVFVMENVKGLLSARLESRGVFERICEDLTNPAAALLREGRSAGGRKPQYEVRALAPESSYRDDDPRRFVVRTEQFGVPQKRHRVILVGVRSDYSSVKLPPLRSSHDTSNVGDALSGLPRVRSGLSKTDDSGEAWIELLRDSIGGDWIGQVDSDVRAKIRSVVDSLTVPRAGRGAEVWGSDDSDLVLNHSTRGHMSKDLYRYLFSSCFASVRRVSPVMAEFPKRLLPAHANLEDGAEDVAFGDRFRTQLAGEPSTTVTSHISKDGHYYIHHDPTQCRSLTVREAARLQTFPDNYFFCGPRTSQYQQVGNAVPPKLAAQIAKSVAALF